MRSWWVVVAVGVVLAGRPAHAECALRTAASPNEPPIPLRGVVFAYVDSFEPIPTNVAWEHGTGTSTETRLSPSVVRIDYAGPAGANLVVNHTRYTLASVPPAPRVPTLGAVSRHAGQWTCSRYDVLRIPVQGDAAAVRARWTHAGHTTDHWVVPSKGAIELGKVDCGGTTIPPSELDDGGTLELLAVFPDGTEHRIAEPFPVTAPSSPRTVLGIAALLVGLCALVLARVLLPRVRTR